MDDNTPSPHALSLDAIRSGDILPDYIDPDTLTGVLGVSKRTLQRWHAARRGPARCKVGNLIRYRIEAVRDWLAANEERPVVRRADRRSH